ncbi:MAG: CHASE2 domain-containing protein [Phormidesmis sp. RL_2_1]|nr:CHASE2 domain-containing protein [Phormidesmis sp. RL_2_1]
MFSLRYRIKKGHRIAVVGIGVAGSLVLATIGGFFEGLELAMLDQFFRLRAVPEVVVDDRILVVTIGEEDISAAGQWPISDATLAELVEQLNEHQPAVIGLDLYRNLPIEPGVEQLVEVFETTPNVIGVERVVGESVGAHNTLTQKGQTASSDVIVDSDRKIRRGLLSVITPSGEVRQGLASALALRYLSNFDIVPEALDSGGLSLQLGKGRVTRFDKNAGGYVDQDAGGFQVIMNYRGDYRQFESVSMTTVLDGGLTDEMVRDRVVLVGSTAISLNDLFHTPLHGDEQVAGVYIHAHLVSQLLWLALEGRPLLRTVPDAVEWLWTMLWVATSVVASRSVFYSKSFALGGITLAVCRSLAADRGWIGHHWLWAAVMGLVAADGFADGLHTGGDGVGHWLSQSAATKFGRF